MKPNEPFQLLTSPLSMKTEELPEQRKTFVKLSVAVGARTIDELQAELGLPKRELKCYLATLVATGVLKECALSYYPHPEVVVHAGDWSGDVDGS